MAGKVTDGWVKCPPGEFEQLAARLRFHRRCRAVLTVLGAVLVGSGLLFGAANAWSALTEPQRRSGASGCCSVPAAPASCDATAPATTTPTK
jgi:hypothetical protein